MLTSVMHDDHGIRVPKGVESGEGPQGIRSPTTCISNDGGR
jgi:hypothetical protein